ncbi:hypothetical protein Ccrd_019659 [Cynara cardunculus var. scolymus]|uniref:DUF1664 domain-containing protein n=1 Tax=Cynara cardunculus var. scolymus TaxID=59895 RepID=A0A103Y3Y2_CYNCS|nr:hypothetical protein Ccrd_019659 [Cynara cardunculus var. scolymus]
MAMQTGVNTSKLLILVGAGVTSSVILRSGRLSDVLSELQELMRGVNEVEISPGKYDSAALAAQIRQLAQEIRELSLSRPVTIFNGNSTSSGGYSSYLVPAAALGAMGYCYMWWKGLSLSDVMFVTKHNMANAVATVSKQLENVSDALASTKRHLSKRLENLDWKLDEQKEMSKLIADDVNDVKSNLNQIGYDIDMIHQMVAGLVIQLGFLGQDMTNSGLYYLCHVAGGIKDGINAKLFQDIEAKLGEHSKITYEETSLKGLQFLTETDDTEKYVLSKSSSTKVNRDSKSRFHRSYPVGLSSAKDMLG